ncbi:hypothetical protein OS175_14415 [Marinicella sp. S1101]|uniref:hypothetical protein n=1 Tax=Marinicella marina TaxID=2996016 RepID=UPI002260F937|nr:hypothetical protein [Marinicella marina]MCX7555067.1 hypothetical protein [Marinicella marina]MDJ1141375.1 hypothetical protein [Marinicella marina]
MLNVNDKRKKVMILILGMTFSSAFAQYEITKNTINSGGGTLENGAYQLNGSIAQVDATVQMTEDEYALNGGFWQQNNDLIFRSGFE